jgi:hypothetical protein
MSFNNLSKANKYLVSICISIFLSLFSTFFLIKIEGGKVQISVMLKENYNSETYILFSHNSYVSNLFENTRLDYFINLLQNRNNFQRMLFFKNYNFSNYNDKCSKGMFINYIIVDKKNVLLEIADKKSKKDSVNLCISSIVDFLNNSINENINKNNLELNINKEKFLVFALAQNNFRNEDEKLNYIASFNTEKIVNKNPIIIAKKKEIISTKVLSPAIYFILLFICYEIIFVSILLRKKIFLYLKK